jgi:hypothetical protein
VLKDGFTPLLIVAAGRFGASIFGNHYGPTLHAAMQPPEEARPRIQPLGCGHTPGAPAPWWGLPRDRLCVVGSWVGLGPAHVGA